MKTRNVIILSIGIVFALSQCKDDDEVEYSNSEIVIDNVLATLYFHTVFYEAEYAWAIVDSFLNYSSSEDYIERHKINNNAFKMLTYVDTAKIHVATIEYNEWETNNLILNGTFDRFFNQWTDCNRFI